jgi:hypothetical protein
MQEGETGYTAKKGHNRGTGIEAVLGQAPRLQCAARIVQHLDRLTLGDPLGVQSTILHKQVCTFAARSALVTLLIATWRLLDYRSHSDLLFPSFASVYVRVQDGEVAFWFQPLWLLSHWVSGASSSPSGRCRDRGLQTFQLIPTLTSLENVIVPVELRGDRRARPLAVELLQ